MNQVHQCRAGVSAMALRLRKIVIAMSAERDVAISGWGGGLATTASLSPYVKGIPCNLPETPRSPSLTLADNTIL